MSGKQGSDKSQVTLSNLLLPCAAPLGQSWASAWGHHDSDPHHHSGFVVGWRMTGGCGCSRAQLCSCWEQSRAWASGRIAVCSLLCLCLEGPEHSANQELAIKVRRWGPIWKFVNCLDRGYSLDSVPGTRTQKGSEGTG